MSRFGKKQEDQLAYRCEKLEKRICMLLEHIKNVERSNRVYESITMSVLNKMGGAIVLTAEDAPENVYIESNWNEETKTTTLLLKERLKENNTGPTESEQEDGHV